MRPEDRGGGHVTDDAGDGGGPGGRIGCRVEGEAFEDLVDGDVVTVTHADAGIQGALGLVSRDRLSPVAQNIRVILLPET